MQLTEAAKLAKVVMKGRQKCLYTAGANEWGLAATMPDALCNNRQLLLKSFKVMKGC